MEPLKFNSLASMFFACCNRSDFLGWNQRVNGNWVHFPREHLKNEVYALALALKKRGVQERESIGIIAPSSPAWIMADIATQINHAQVVPLFPNISSENFLFQCEDADVQILIIERLNDLDLPLREHLARFKTVVYLDENSEPPANGVLWEDLVKEGRALLKNTDEFLWICEQLNSIDPDSIFSIIYTSGSTGRPKGVEISHRNILVQLQNITQLFDIYPDKDRILTMLPVAHIFERMAVYFYIFSGVPIYFADTPNNAAVMMTEVKPTVMIVVPRILERVYESMTAAADKAHGPKSWLIKQAIKLAKMRDPQKRPGFIHFIYDHLVYSKMRAAVGGSFRVILSGSSALNKSISRFLVNIGLPVFEGYGLTECAPVVSVNYFNNRLLGSVGKPLSNVQVRIGENQEICVKGENVFKGYHNMPELNREIFTEDGFFKTGDQGSLDENGYLFITGRIKELLKTSTGKYVSPNPIELEINRHPLVEQAQVIANNRKFVSVLIFVNAEGARRFLKLKKEEFSMEKALQSKTILEAIRRQVLRVNKKVNHWERIRKWTLIGDELTIESGLLTPTLKLRRKVTEERYKENIEKMYEIEK